MSKVEATYLSLKKQQSFSNWFLAYLGCDMTNKSDIHGIAHEPLTNDWGTAHKGLFKDDLLW